MDDARRRVKDKITLLLRKTTEAGCTEAEAQSAFALAMRLMAEHNLSMADLDAASHGGSATVFVEQTTGNIGQWLAEYQLACSICTRHFFVHAFKTTTVHQGSNGLTITFFGTRENVDVARFVFSSLLAAFDRLWLAHRKRKPWSPKGDRRAYVVGVAKGFSDRLDEERAVMRAENEILGNRNEIQLASVVEALNAAFQRKYPEMGQGEGLNLGGLSESALQQGYQAGRNLTLARGMEGSGGAARALPKH
jgi:hypothetical protein